MMYRGSVPVEPKNIRRKLISDIKVHGSGVEGNLCFLSGTGGILTM